MKEQWKKNTTIFLVSQALSIFGSSLIQYAITWHITLTTQSGLYATLTIVCGFLPTLLLSPIAGIWADRYNRKKLIIIADGGIALCTLILAFVYMSGFNGLWPLFIVVCVRALGSAVQTPCVNAMLPDLVPREQLTRINGINSTINALLSLVSPMVSAALLGIAALDRIFFIDVVTAAIAIVVLLAFLKLPAHRRTQKLEAEASTGNRKHFSDLKMGLHYIGERPYLYIIFIFAAIFFFMTAPVAFLMPLQTARTFGNDVWRLSAIEIIFSVGMMIGGLTIAAWGGFKNRIHTMVLGNALISVTVISMGLFHHFWLYLVMMALCGLALSVFNTPAMVMLQERVDPDYMGRVFAVLTMISSSITPLSMLLWGPLADAVPIELLLIGTGIVLAFMTVCLFFNRSLLEAGKRIPNLPEKTEP